MSDWRAKKEPELDGGVGKCRLDEAAAETLSPAAAAAAAVPSLAAFALLVLLVLVLEDEVRIVFGFSGGNTTTSSSSEVGSSRSMLLLDWCGWRLGRIMSRGSACWVESGNAQLDLKVPVEPKLSRLPLWCERSLSREKEVEVEVEANIAEVGCG